MITLSTSEVSTYYAARVPDLRQQGKRWRGKCPIHHGKHDSFSVDPKSGLWRCWSDCGRGGDIVSLEISLTGARWREAVVEIEGIIGRVLLERQTTSFERQALARRREALDATTQSIQHWRRGRIAEMEKAKANAVACEDEVALAESASALCLLQNGAATVAAYRVHLQRDPLGVQALIIWAREDERHAYAITAAIVNTLAISEVLEHAA